MTAKTTIRLALLACAMLTALVLPAGASAARGLVTGFTGIEQYQTDSAPTRAAWFDRTRGTRAGMVRLALSWAGAAPARPPDPTNPGSAFYDFTSIDGAVRDAGARGLSAMITVNVAPTWAEGAGRPPSAREGTWEPNPSDLADFLQAVAARYSGGFDPDGPGGAPALPAVQAVEVWDEPNSGDWLNPQFVGKLLRRRRPLPRDARCLLQVDQVGQSEDAGDRRRHRPLRRPARRPIPGDRGPFPPRPVLAARALRQAEEGQEEEEEAAKKKHGKLKYVRTAGCSSPVGFDVFAHHPIDNTGGGPLKSGPTKYDASTPDLGRVVRVLRGAEKRGTVSGHHPVWVTEFWWDSRPPNSSGVPPWQQARWIEQSFYLFWKAGASLAINFELADTSGRANVHAGLQSGVYFQDGRPKPSLVAFRFPFVTERINKRRLRAWGKVP